MSRHERNISSQALKSEKKDKMQKGLNIFQMKHKDQNKGEKTNVPSERRKDSSFVLPQKLDYTILTNTNFDVEQYAKSMMQILPTEEAVIALGNQIADVRDGATNDLQRNVYRNYTDFVVIGKEISKLESNMLVFRGLLHELNEVSERFNQLNGGNSAENNVKENIPQKLQDEEVNAAVKREKQQLELREKQDAELKILYTNMDGLQKALPENPNRYIVRDGISSRFTEVSQTNYKDKETCFIYVLNDALLVAIWKKNMISGKNRFTVDKVWPIDEIGYIDMKDSPDVLNAFKIIRGQDTTIYRSDTLEEKRSLLQVIQTVTDEILAKKKAEKKLKEVKPIAIQKQVNEFKDLEKKRKKAILDDLDTVDFRWLVELPDELDVLIAHRDFDQAVDAVTKARKILNAAKGETQRVQILRSTINARIFNLSKLIALDLASPVATKDQVQGDIDKLLRLGLGDQARDIFLSARSATIRSRLRHLKFNGDLPGYIADFSELTFRLIRNTCDWYSGSFHDTEMASGFMKWLQQEIQSFTQTLRRQVFSSKQEFNVVAECLMSTLDQIQELRDVGLDLTFLIDKTIHEDIKKAIENYSHECNEKIQYGIKSDILESIKPNEEIFNGEFMHFDRIPTLSSSCYCFYQVLTTFGSDVGVLISLTLYNTVISSLIKFFEIYFEGLSITFEQSLRNEGYCCLVANSIFVGKQILPKLKVQLSERFERIIPEIDDLEERVSVMITKFQSKYIEQTRISIFQHEFPWHKMDYSMTASIIDQALPTLDSIKLLAVLSKNISEMDEIMEPTKTMQSLILDIFSHMRLNEKRKFGYGGVQNFILDMQFLIAGLDKFITKEINTIANQICGKAIKEYFAQNKDLAAPLKTGEWYEKRIEEAMKKYKKNFIKLV